MGMKDVRGGIRQSLRNKETPIYLVQRSILILVVSFDYFSEFSLDSFSQRTGSQSAIHRNTFNSPISKLKQNACFSEANVSMLIPISNDASVVTAAETFPGIVKVISKLDQHDHMDCTLKYNPCALFLHSSLILWILSMLRIAPNT